MTWEEYYDKFYDWAESTQIKKLSSVDALVLRMKLLMQDYDV